jgi:glycosyltransferase involved in cell wall biosynthesis
MNTSLVSVIIPVYNVEKYLRRCIESVLAQSYTNFEIILIDDGSTDSSGQICDEYAMINNRIKVYHKGNAGVSSARNLGLRYAEGKWIVFVDSDDYVKKDYILHLIQDSSDDIDLVISYAIIDRYGIVEVEQYSLANIDDCNFDILFLQYKIYWHTSPWGKLFRKDIIDILGLTFCEGMHISEDLVFLYTYLTKCHQIKITGKSDYYYFATQEMSLTHRIYSYESEVLAYTKVTEAVKTLINAKNIRNIEACEDLYWNIIVHIDRVLNSIYHFPKRWSRNERLRLISYLDMEFYKDHCRNTMDKKLIILRFLLKLRWYRLYDSIRIIKRELV